MTDQSPTTMNGPLHTPEATLDDRLMTATFSTPAAARAARDTLIQGGIAADRITIIDNAATHDGLLAALQPEDKGIIGKIREAILPDDSKTATLNAARGNEAMLELRPAKSEVESAIRIIEASHPSHFDASLERWRNVG